MVYEIAISNKNPEIHIKDLDVLLPKKNIRVDFSKLFILIGKNLNDDKIKKSIEYLFYDPVTDNYSVKKLSREPYLISGYKLKKEVSDIWEVKVYYRAEVTDPASSFIKKALSDIKIFPEEVRTGKRYILKSKRLSLDEVNMLTRRIFANFIVERALLKAL
jgi:phosphoribosylformylglycinamidine (FGAM) synthase PurS component